MKPNSEHTHNAAYAIVLQKHIAEPFEKAYDTILKRMEAQNKHIEFILLKHDEVILNLQFAVNLIHHQNCISFRILKKMLQN